MSRLVGPGLKAPFVCLECRKCFKCLRPWLVLGGGLVPDCERRVPCPDCGAPMRDYGSTFHAPKRRDRRAWAQIKRVRATGWQRMLCNLPGYRLLKGIEARNRNR